MLARARVFGGINFGDLVKNLPIRQIKIPAKVSGYTVYTVQYTGVPYIHTVYRRTLYTQHSVCTHLHLAHWFTVEHGVNHHLCKLWSAQLYLIQECKEQTA